MTTPPKAGHQTQDCLVLVHKLAEPLMAIANYLEVAARLHRTDSPSARRRLAEVVEKSGRQATRANEILHQMRDLLRQDAQVANKCPDRVD